ncbi:MAG: 4-carboxymuconolactone decarboxylase [Gammaproteobacteria bacterium]
MNDDERRERGTTTRSAVLGAAHVERATANRNAFNAEFQDFITRYAWGDIWQREGLDRRTRSFITLAMLLALGRDDEFSLHVRGALNNGLTQDEIREILMHAAIYCGVPAANHGFKLAQAVFRAIDAGD